MTDNNTNQPAASKKPTHFAYHSRKSNSGKDFNTRIGAGWAHTKGGGINLQFEMVPLDGRVTLFLATEKTA